VLYTVDVFELLFTKCAAKQLTVVFVAIVCIWLVYPIFRSLLQFLFLFLSTTFRNPAIDPSCTSANFHCYFLMLAVVLFCRCFYERSTRHYKTARRDITKHLGHAARLPLNK